MSEVTTMEVAPVPGMNRATVKLIEKMKQGKPGDKLMAQELQDITEHDCRPRTHGKGYSYLGSAIRYCLNNFGIVWAWQRDCDCIECLSDKGKLNAAESMQKHVYRTGKRELKVLKAADPKGLDTDEDRRAYAARVAIAGTIVQVTAAKTVKKLTADTRDVDRRKLLEAMIGS